MKIRRAKIEDVEQIISIMIELQKLHIKGRKDIFKKKEYKEAKKEKCSRLELNCWAFNKNAIEFYKNIGMNKQRINMELKVEE